VSTRPTDQGKTFWPASEGYLSLKAGANTDARRVPCTCSDACAEPDCRGLCGCEACALAWLVYMDDHALWDDSGKLVMSEDHPDGWQDIEDTNTIYTRCHLPFTTGLAAPERKSAV
jgi:hypothetical protein